jgi:hypothetical protein
LGGFATLSENSTPATTQLTKALCETWFIVNLNIIWKLLLMAITDKSDKEIIEIVKPMIDEVVKASSQKDWQKFRKY